MADVDNPLEQMKEELRARHPDRDFRFDYMPNMDEGDGGQWMTIEEDGEQVVSVDYKPRQQAYGVTRPYEDGGYPQDPDVIYEGEDAYDEALEGVEEVLENPGPRKPAPRR